MGIGSRCEQKRPTTKSRKTTIFFGYRVPSNYSHSGKINRSCDPTTFTFARVHAYLPSCIMLACLAAFCLAVAVFCIDVASSGCCLSPLRCLIVRLMLFVLSMLCIVCHRLHFSSFSVIVSSPCHIIIIDVRGMQPRGIAHKCRLYICVFVCMCIFVVSASYALVTIMLSACLPITVSLVCWPACEFPYR